MSYIPKSKYQILQSSGDDYVNSETGTYYIGPYILTSEGAFIGNNITKRGPRLIKSDQFSDLRSSNNIRFYQNTTLYNEANSDKIYSQLAGTKNIVATKTKPTDKDYQIGHYTRYFCKRNNSNNIFYEIDKPTYKALVGKKSTYDWHLYTAGSLRWAIDGNIIQTNSNILKRKEREFPNISNFFVRLNEYQKIRKTQGGELRYLDGRNYVGYYHVHQNKPMVGLFHTSKSHETLEYVNEAKAIELSGGMSSEPPTQNMGYSAPENVQSQISTPSTPSTGGGSSGGGGGGY
jgi:uncharacterized membrane protein YgcG